MPRLHLAKVRGLLFVLILLGLAPLPGARSVAAQEAENQYGPVTAVALDAQGNGWAWAASQPQTVFNAFLIRIENGASRVVDSAQGDDSSGAIPNGALLSKMVLSSNGTGGWAIGALRSLEDHEEFSPFLMRLRNGTWTVALHSFPSTLQLLDITIAPDESDGWMTAYDDATRRYRLLRLRNGSWNFVSLPANGGALEAVALSPDGKQGWAAGPRSSTSQRTASPAAYRLNNGSWEVVAGNLAAEATVASWAVADNAGNGWLIARRLGDAGLSSRGAGQANRLTQAGQVLKRDLLIRLSRNAAPRTVNLVLPEPGIVNTTNADFILYDLALDSTGRGYAVGAIYRGDREDPPLVETLYTPALYHLQGDTADLVPMASVGYDGEEGMRPRTVDSSPDGAHTWIGGNEGFDFGRLQEIREAWSHDRPAAAGPLPGAGRCFAEVSYCMRGVFAQYWQQKGGLDLFGYPLTPEVQENIGGKVYTVQYTQRARFEHHPEFRGTPNEVLLGLLGNTLVESRMTEEPFQPKSPGIVPSEEWFEETQHNVRPPFLEYWQRNGGLPVYGLPRSEAFEERNAADGKTYLVQYFERNRLEYHPENRGTRFEMLLGLLGTEQFQKTYGFTP